MLREFPLINANESVDDRIIRFLRVEGQRVFSIGDETPGISDFHVIDIAVEKHGYILTEDKDFGDIIVYNSNSKHKTGSLLLRILDLPISAKNQLILETLLHNSAQLKECFVVLKSKKLRIRKYTS